MGRKRHERYDIEFKRQAVTAINRPELRTQDVATGLAIHPFFAVAVEKGDHDSITRSG